MGASTVRVRCPACGGELRVVLAPEPPTQWFPCPHCSVPVPVVVPRDLPPLYTWEILPGLYPALPRPRAPRWRARGAAAAALAVVAVVAAALAAGLVYDAWDAGQPASFAVDGTVGYSVGGVVEPLAGAQVTLANDANQTRSVVTGADGAFSFGHVPSGGVAINVSAIGYSPVTVDTFVSAVYNAGATGLTIVLTAGATGNGSTVSLSPFPDLETFLASVGSGAVLLGIIALVGGFSGIATVRHDRPALGIVGGAAGVLAPFVPFYLSFSSALPLIQGVSAIAAGAGAFALALRTVQMAQTGSAPDLD